MRQDKTMKNIRHHLRFAHVSLVGSGMIGVSAAMAPLLLGIYDAQAAEWSATGRINQEFNYDDNIRLDPDDETDTFGSVTTPEFFIKGVSPTTEIEINPRLQLGVFTDDSSLNYFDQRLGFSARRLLQTGDYGINIDLSREATLVSENEDTGRNDDDDGERYELDTNPFYTIGLSERDRVRLRGKYQKVAYQNTGDDDLDDFTVFGGSVDYEYDLTLTDMVGATFNYRHFNNDDDGREESDAVGLEGIWRHSPSERLTTEVAPGIRYVWRDERTTNGGVSSTDSDEQFGGTIRASVAWEADERTNLNFTLFRGLDGSGGGNVVLRDRLGLNVRHRFTERLAFNFISQYVRSADSTSLGFSDPERDFVRLRPSVGYQLTRDLTISGGYQLRWEDDRDEDDTATSNAVFLELTYNTPVWNFD